MSKHYCDRHPSAAERKILGALLEEIGPAELIVIIGQHLAHEHPDIDAGNALRTELARVAAKVRRTEGGHRP